MDFKDKIKKHRLELGLTLEDIAKLVGVTAPTIQRYESGEIKNVGKNKIKALADALNLSPSYLMDWDEVPEVKKSFEYFMEMQLALLGYKIIYDEEDGYIILKSNEGEYEISEDAVNNLTNELKSFLSFRVFDLMQNSRRLG